jgi:DNA-binding MurR/RpiR family transcriptional regulator
MFDAPLRADILAQYDALPRQLQAAARWALDHPQDIALLSMREQARRAGVVPVTMTRLAQRLGYSGYEAIRALYVEKMRRGDLVFSGKAKALVERRKLKGDTALAFDLLDTLARQIHDLASGAARERLKKAALQLGRAERIYVIGQRSSYPIAFHFAYVLGLVHAGVRLLDGPGATGTDALRGAGKNDALVAISVRPYTRDTVEVTDFVVRQGIALIAITDSELSPLCGRARASILVPTESPSFFHTMTPAFAVAEALAALVAAASGTEGLAAMRKMERQFAALSTHILPHSPPETER